MAPFEALYGRHFRSPACWLEAGGNKLLGPKMIQDTTVKIDLIRGHIHIAQDRQNNYADADRRHIELDVSD